LQVGSQGDRETLSPDLLLGNLLLGEGFTVAGLELIMLSLQGFIVTL
jgi:hypothetical protein